MFLLKSEYAPNEFPQFMSDVAKAINGLTLSHKEQSEKELSPQPSTDNLIEHYTRKEAAKYLRVSLGTLHNLMNANVLTGYLLGSKRIFKKSELDAALKNPHFNKKSK